MLWFSAILLFNVSFANCFRKLIQGGWDSFSRRNWRTVMLAPLGEWYYQRFLISLYFSSFGVLFFFHSLDAWRFLKLIILPTNLIFANKNHGNFMQPVKEMLHHLCNIVRHFRKQQRHTSQCSSPRKGFLSAWKTWMVCMCGPSSTGL